MGSLPYFVLESFFPPALDVTCFAETIDYEFRDSAHAAEFAELNRGAHLVGDG